MKRGLLVILILLLFIPIVTAGETDDLLLTVKVQLNNAADFFLNTTSDVKDTADIMGYLTKMALSLDKIEAYEIEIVDATSTKKLEIKQELQKIQKEFPKRIKQDIFTFDNNIDYESLPDPKLFTTIGDEPEENYKISFYNFAKKASVIPEARKVTVTYLNGATETFRLVKKKISAPSNTEQIVELIPSSININDIELITTGSKTGSMIKYAPTVTEIVYKLDTGDLIELAKTTTIAIPDFKKIEITPQKTPTCGDGDCSVSEFYEFDEADPNNQYYCKDDCVSKKPKYLIILAVILIIGVAYINFYKGPGNFHEVINTLSTATIKKPIFTSERDLEDLGNYVKVSLEKGFQETNIKKILENKGWTNEQIKRAFDKVKWKPS